ncbi:hypothetical protein CVT24_012456 [Panaeolus cyanescens]|uniref:Protein kinase domain-containing protein n=1 Tax=Panaeolus cyanescens TaxID=181874 RepID=A0A409X4C9_9AGAR|nr:hypothetical protein CVT24_012456 [Panaeolus cyanescens]
MSGQLPPHPRPTQGTIYEDLGAFFPRIDLEEPVVQYTVENPSMSSNNGDNGPRTFWKSLGLIARERRRQQEISSPVDYRYTQLWGYRIEEVTTAGTGSLVPVATPNPEPHDGRNSAKWVKGELIGRGTYGRTYIALNATRGELIAVKQIELPQTNGQDNSPQHQLARSFNRESETLKDLEHTNIVKYLGFEMKPSVYIDIFMEYVPGGSVGSYTQRYGRFHDCVTKSFTAQILSALEYLHSKGIRNRDLRGDNILVDGFGTCKISDYGISYWTDTNSNLQGNSAFVGLPGSLFWTAPETFVSPGEIPGFKPEIWSVGCVAIEMWTGSRPWAEEEMVAVMFKVRKLLNNGLAPSLPEDVHISEEAEDFRQKCFKRNPQERPSAEVLRRHPYLTLPPDWRFNGFV